MTLDPLEFLFGLERLGMKFGLDNMRTLCAALDHPERAFRSVVVAGTNGKGSVTAMTSAALHAAGQDVARYTSPHLERLEERFVMGEREVGSARYFRSLEMSFERKRDGIHPTLAASQKWMDAVASWVMSTSAAPIRLHLPQKSGSPRPRARVFPPPAP